MPIPRTWSGQLTAADLAPTLALPGAQLSSNQSVRRESKALGTIATTGSGEVIVRAPITGALATVSIVGNVLLTKSDTNYLTFSSINKQTGAGSTALLTAVAGNTTQATGGFTMTAYTPQALALGATLAVTGGDVITFAWTIVGTLANTVTAATVMFVFTSTT